MLTKRQKQILDFVNTRIKKNGLSPTLEEIARHFRLSSLATVHEHLQELKKKKFIKKLPKYARAIEIVKKNSAQDTINIPLIGTITAGEPVETYEIPERITVPKNLLTQGGEHFALKVSGDSMIDEGIFDGDTVIIRRQQTAENGDNVVALINGSETTLKKIYREKRGFRLQPANSALKPIFVKNLEIQGKVISVIRTFKELEELIKENKEFNPATIKYIKETSIQYRKSFGQYFTPKSIRELLFSKLPDVIKKPKILDPACGTGEFLITAKKYFKDPKLYGWEIDNNLVGISKKNVPETHLKCIDSLKDEQYNSFDYIIGNPPYYEFTPSEKIRNKFKTVINGRVNIFSLFVYQGLKWLKDGGYLAYVVPPSMNNGAYFSKLRKFIVDNSNIEYLHVLDDPKLFHGAQQTTMLLILKKGKNKGNYIFKKNGLLIFSEEVKYLENAFKNKIALCDFGYEVKTGKIIWNENKNLLTNDQRKGVLLIWAQNITSTGLNLFTNNKKPQYIKKDNPNIGPAIVVNRITGSVKTAKLKAAIVPPGMKFFAENHVNVITPPKNIVQRQLELSNDKTIKKQSISLDEVAKQLSSQEKLKVIRNITGNTQISKTELERLFPIDV